MLRFAILASISATTRLCATSAAEGGRGDTSGTRYCHEIPDAIHIAERIDEWMAVCEEQGKEEDGEGVRTATDGQSRKARVERVFRAVLSQERHQVLSELRSWLPFMLSEYPNSVVLGSSDRSQKLLMAMAALERSRDDQDVEIMRCHHIAVRPTVLGPVVASQGGWTPEEDYSALAMVEGVKAYATDLGLKMDFSPLAEVHEGRIYLKSDPFNPQSFGGIM